MKKLFTLLIAVSLVAAIASLVVAANNAPEEVTFSPKIGTVTFNHTQHLAVGDCVSCHHTGDHVSCSSCHGAQPAIATAKDAFHANCIDCHKEVQKGPTGCRDCHVK